MLESDFDSKRTYARSVEVVVNNTIEALLRIQTLHRGERPEVVDSGGERNTAQADALANLAGELVADSDILDDQVVSAKEETAGGGGAVTVPVEVVCRHSGLADTVCRSLGHSSRRFCPSLQDVNVVAARGGRHREQVLITGIEDLAAQCPGEESRYGKVLVIE